MVDDDQMDNNSIKDEDDEIMLKVQSHKKLLFSNQ